MSIRYCWMLKNTITTTMAPNDQAMSIFMLVILWPQLTKRPAVRPRKSSPRMHFLQRIYRPLSTDDSFYSLDPMCIYFFSYLFSQKAILFSTGMVMMVMMAVAVVMVVVVVFRYYKNKVENGKNGNFIEFPPSP